MVLEEDFVGCISNLLHLHLLVDRAVRSQIMSSYFISRNELGPAIPLTL